MIRSRLAVHGAVLDRLFRWQRYPSLFQWPLVALTAAVAVLSMRPPQHSEMNVGAALVWQLWWTLLPLFTLLFARSWCAVCPFAALSDLVQRLRSTPPPAPFWMRRVGPWLGTGGIAALGFLFLLLSLESNGPLTSSLLLAFALGAVGTALLWRDRLWCRQICPLGRMLGLYARLAWLRLEPIDDAGRKAAALSARSCPQCTSPVASQKARDCILCAACLQSPEGGSIKARLRWPRLSGHYLPPPEAAAVSLLMGLMLADALRMTPLFSRFMARVVPMLGDRYELSMALGMAGIVALVALVQAGVALKMGGAGEGWTSFSHLSMILLPLVLATQLALSAQHLLAAGEVLRNLAAEVGFLSPGHMPPPDAYSVVWPVKGLQWAMLVAAAGLAIRADGGGKGRQRRTSTVVALLLGLTLLAVFVQPMSLTC